MSRIVWDSPEDRLFEAGVERGVLYVGNQRGVPWNGLISVSDSYTNGEVVARYQDGVKTHNYAPTQEFETEITAFTYPDEFEECLGLGEVTEGLYIDEQDRRPFGVAYQTRVGTDRGVKIHLIYNAIAVPNQITRNTMSDNPELTNFSWGIKTAPIEAPGHRPSSHFVLDSTTMGPRMFDHLKDQIYGAPGVIPRLITPTQIINIAGEWTILYPSNTTYPSLDTLPGGP